MSSPNFHHRSVLAAITGIVSSFIAVDAAHARGDCNFPPANWQMANQAGQPADADNFGPLSDGDNIVPMVESLRFSESGVITEVSLTGAFITQATGANATPVAGSHSIRLVVMRGKEYRPLHIAGEILFDGLLPTTPELTGNQMVSPQRTLDEYQLCLSLPAPLQVERGETLFFAIADVSVGHFADGQRFLWNWGPIGLGDGVCFSGDGFILGDLSIGTNLQVMQVSQLADGCDQIAHPYVIDYETSPVLQLPVGKCFDNGGDPCVQVIEITNQSTKPIQISGCNAAGTPIAVTVFDGPCDTGLQIAASTDINECGAGAPLTLDQATLPFGATCTIQFTSDDEGTATVFVDAVDTCTEEPEYPECTYGFSSILDPENPLWTNPVLCWANGTSFGNTLTVQVEPGPVTIPYRVQFVEFQVQWNTGGPMPVEIRILRDDNGFPINNDPANYGGDTTEIYSHAVAIPGDIQSPTTFRVPLPNSPLLSPTEDIAISVHVPSNAPALGGTEGMFAALAQVLNAMSPGLGETYLETWECGVLAPTPMSLVGAGGNAFFVRAGLSTCDTNNLPLFGTTVALGENTQLAGPFGTDIISLAPIDPGQPVEISATWGKNEGTKAMIEMPNGIGENDVVTFTNRAFLPCTPIDEWENASLQFAGLPNDRTIVGLFGPAINDATASSTTAFLNGEQVSIINYEAPFTFPGVFEAGFNLNQVEISQHVERSDEPTDQTVVFTLKFPVPIEFTPDQGVTLTTDKIEFRKSGLTGFNLSQFAHSSITSTTTGGITVSNMGPTLHGFSFLAASDTEIALNAVPLSPRERTALKIRNLIDEASGVDIRRLDDRQVRCGSASVLSGFNFENLILPFAISFAYVDALSDFNTVSEYNTSGFRIVPDDPEPGQTYTVIIYEESFASTHEVASFEVTDLQYMRIAGGSFNDLENLSKTPKAEFWELEEPKWIEIHADGQDPVEAEGNRIVIVKHQGGGSSRFGFAGPTSDPTGISIRASGFTTLAISEVTLIASRPGDVDDDGIVGVTDLLTLLGDWGICLPPCPSDFSGEGMVSVEDLLILLTNWGL